MQNTPHRSEGSGVRPHPARLGATTVLLPHVTPTTAVRRARALRAPRRHDRGTVRTNYVECMRSAAARTLQTLGRKLYAQCIAFKSDSNALAHESGLFACRKASYCQIQL